MTGEPSALDTDDELVPDEPLTTKEGWRRFVDHQPEPPETPDPVAMLALPARRRAEWDDARRDYHAELPLVNTPTIRQVLTTGRLLVQLNRCQISARRGLILSGASGTGKTTALTNEIAISYLTRLAALPVCAHRWDLIEQTHDHDTEPGDAWHHWVRRAAMLIPPGTEADTFSPSRLFAAAYPEAVNLATLIGPLRWGRLAAGDPDDQRRFTDANGTCAAAVHLRPAHRPWRLAVGRVRIRPPGRHREHPPGVLRTIERPPPVAPEKQLEVLGRMLLAVQQDHDLRDVPTALAAHSAREIRAPATRE